MKRRWICSVAVLVALATRIDAQNQTGGTDPASLLKDIEAVSGLTAQSDPALYDASTLEQYDPRLAPSLKLYGLKSVTRQRWATRGETVEVVLFEMLDSGAAYGIYTLQQSAERDRPTPTLIGAASFLRGNQLHFWQSNFYVRLSSPDRLLNPIAETISRSIPGRSRKPPVSEYLPAQGLVEGTEKYLLSADFLDLPSGLDPQKLGFDSSAEAATASYRIDGAPAKLLLLLYPTQHIARKYAEAMEADLKAAFTKRAGPLLAIVYGSNNDIAAASILDDVSHEFKVTWDEPPPGLGLGTMLITIFTFIGLSLAFTAFAGVSFGGLRVFVKSRYPDRVFDRPESMEIIQLKLNEGVTPKQITQDTSPRTS